MITITKYCKKCGIEKAATTENFRLNKSSKDKLFSWCIECQNKYNEELYFKNREKRLTQIEQWNFKNNNKTRKYKKKWARNRVLEQQEKYKENSLKNNLNF